MALALICIYAGGIKLLHSTTFAAITTTYDFVPDALLFIMTIGLPLIETATGLERNDKA